MVFNFINNTIFSNPNYLVRVFESLFLSFLSLEFLRLVDFDFFPKENPISFLMLSLLKSRFSPFVSKMYPTVIIKRQISQTQLQSIEQNTGFRFGRVLEPKSSIFAKASGHPNIYNPENGESMTFSHSKDIIESGKTVSGRFFSLLDLNNIFSPQYFFFRIFPMNVVCFSALKLTNFNEERVFYAFHLFRLSQNFKYDYDEWISQCQKTIESAQRLGRQAILKDAHYVCETRLLIIFNNKFNIALSPDRMNFLNSGDYFFPW